MSIELAEKLKAKLTDRWVVVDGSVPELRRFSQWTGKVRTVNMNGRALVEFDGPADIGWYDIDPAFLTVVDGPRPKVAPAADAKADKPAAKGAAPAAASAAPAAKAPVAEGTGKPSPLDMIRKQQAAKKVAGSEEPPAAEAVAAADVPAAEPAPAPKAEPAATTGPDGKKLSPIEMIRKMGAAKNQ